MEIIKPIKTTQYGDIVVYHVAENSDIEVRVADDTVWLSQAQMAMLFGVKENTVTYHIKEIYKIRELEVEATTRKIRVVRQEGNRMVNRYTERITNQFQTDLCKYNTQYPPIATKEIEKVHDRFLIIDQQKLYHFGASFKDLGKRLFVVSQIEEPTVTEALIKVFS